MIIKEDLLLTNLLASLLLAFVSTEIAISFNLYPCFVGYYGYYAPAFFFWRRHYAFKWIFYLFYNEFFFLLPSGCWFYRLMAALMPPRVIILANGMTIDELDRKNNKASDKPLANARQIWCQDIANLLQGHLPRLLSRWLNISIKDYRYLIWILFIKHIEYDT